MEYNLTRRFVDEVSKSVVGRSDIIRLLLISLLSQGHVLLEGNPGLGKTTLAKAFAQAIGGDFNRIQMTPDILPADILGTYIFNQRTSSFELHKGPIFGNVILVDELNRATPKAQSALLESMQERQVSTEGETIRLNEPFMVVATQVAFGTAGTYPLSEVQADRFAFSVQMEYPTPDQEKSILSNIDLIESSKREKILSLDEIVSNIEIIKNKVYVSEAVKNYIVSLLNFLRASTHLKMPPSTRGSIALYKSSRVAAFLDGRDHVIPDDVKALAPFVLQHRVFLKPEALTEDITQAQLVAQMLKEVPVPRE